VTGPARHVGATIVIVALAIAAWVLTGVASSGASRAPAAQLAGAPARAVSVPMEGVRAVGISSDPSSVFEGPVPRAQCGPGSLPETGLQGQVPLADRNSGRSTKGYRCNLALVGQYQGEGASWVSQSYGQCAYMSARFPSAAKSPGVQVIDVSDPASPRLAGTLTSPAMLGPWESLKVNARRGLLAAISAPAPAGNGVGFFDIYDISGDCRKPRLLNSVSTTQLSLPVNALGHEGNWSPDGNTYWGTGLSAGSITAIDVSDPTHPRTVFTGSTGIINHGFGVSEDGNRLYIAEIGNASQISTGQGQGDPQVEPNGLKIFDVSDIQARKLAPQIREVGHVYWTDGAIGQHAIPISYAGRPYVVFVDESGQGAARIIDISDETNPRIVSKLKLEIHMPQAASLRAADTQGTGTFGYEGHYCDVNRQADPTALACGYFQSGVRVFDIHDPSAPREIAYFNPPAQTGNAQLQSSEHGTGPLGVSSGGGPAKLTADWCSSPPRFVGDQLWVTCQDNGFMVLRFTTQTPVTPATTQASAVAQLALRCSRRKLTLIDVHARGKRVLLRGAASSSLLGKRVDILFNDHKTVAKAAVGSDGLFSTSAPLPPAKIRNTNRARYLARAGGARSLDLKLSRRLILDSITGHQGRVTIVGKVVSPLARPAAPIAVQQVISCTRTVTVKRARPSASGRFHITLTAPANVAAAVYRLSTHVRKFARNPRLFATFSLPEPVVLR
jgi:hypothetical protein